MCLGQTFENSASESGKSVTGPGFSQGDPEFKKGQPAPLILALENMVTRIARGIFGQKDVGDLQSISYRLQRDGYNRPFKPSSTQSLNDFGKRV